MVNIKQVFVNEGQEIIKEIRQEVGVNSKKKTEPPPASPAGGQNPQFNAQNQRDLKQVYGGDEAASKIGQIGQMNEADEKLRRQQWKLLTGKDMIVEHHQAAESLGEQPPEPPETPEQKENPPGPKIPEEEVLPSFDETAALPTGRKTGLNLKFQRKSNVRQGPPKATKLRTAETRAGHGIGG